MVAAGWSESTTVEEITTKIFSLYGAIAAFVSISLIIIANTIMPLSQKLRKKGPNM